MKRSTRRGLPGFLPLNIQNITLDTHLSPLCAKTSREGSSWYPARRKQYGDRSATCCTIYARSQACQNLSRHIATGSLFRCCPGIRLPPPWIGSSSTKTARPTSSCRIIYGPTSSACTRSISLSLMMPPGAYASKPLPYWPGSNLKLRMDCSATSRIHSYPAGRYWLAPVC